MKNDEMLTTQFPGGKFENSCHFVEYHGNRDELFETSSETTCEIIPFYTTYVLYLLCPFELKFRINDLMTLITQMGYYVNCGLKG